MVFLLFLMSPLFKGARGIGLSLKPNISLFIAFLITHSKFYGDPSSYAA
jgi:hypothetical protein